MSQWRQLAKSKHYRYGHGPKFCADTVYYEYNRRQALAWGVVGLPLSLARLHSHSKGASTGGVATEASAGRSLGPSTSLSLRRRCTAQERTASPLD